jgi:hypothetical protein
LPEEIRVHLNANVYEIEASLNTQGDVTKKPTLSAIAKCVKKLCNIIAPCEDGITSPSLKECYVAIC